MRPSATSPRRAKGHDALAVVTDPALIGLPDDQILARALAALLDKPGQIHHGHVLFLTRH